MSDEIKTAVKTGKYSSSRYIAIKPDSGIDYPYIEIKLDVNVQFDPETIKRLEELLDDTAEKARRIATPENSTLLSAVYGSGH